MAGRNVNQAVAAVRALFDDGEIPEGFSHRGQSFEERCEGWVLHALEELEDEIKAFEDEGESEVDDQKQDAEASPEDVLAVYDVIDRHPKEWRKHLPDLPTDAEGLKASEVFEIIETEGKSNVKNVSYRVAHALTYLKAHGFVAQENRRYYAVAGLGVAELKARLLDTKGEGKKPSEKEN